MLKPAQLLAVLLALAVLYGCQSSQTDQGRNSQASASTQAPQSESQDEAAVDAFVFDGSEPVAKKIPYEITNHGLTRVDNYYWLRDDERQDKEVLAYLAHENAYADAKLAHTKPLQDELFEEITGRMKKDDSTVPYRYKNYLYYARYEGDKEYPIIARKPSLDAQSEEVLLDGNAMAADSDYFSIGEYAISTNEKLMAYSTDTVSRRLYDIYFKDLTSGEILEDKLENTTGQVVWANDNQTVFYINKDPQTLLGYQVYRHEIGTSQQRDVLVYEEDDKSFYTWLDKTKDESTIAIYHSSTTTQAVSIIDANLPKSTFELFAPRESGHEYSIAKLGDWFYVRSNWLAPNFRIMKVQNSQRSNKSRWQEVVAHNDKVLLENYDVFEKYLVVQEKEKGQSRMRVHSLLDTRSHVVGFNDPAYVVELNRNPQIQTDKLRIQYSSLTTPTTVYDYDMSTRDKIVLKQDQVVGGYESSNYKSERIFVAARDGKSVPVSLVYRKELFKQDGSNPLYLYGYGSYGYNVEPRFSGARLSLLDRGFVFAIAHIRGSQTLGRAWYDDGKLFNKKNTFNDFIDVSKALIEQQYADANNLFAAGGSAGGLLMGAVINTAPELYKGVAAHVPFVDVVTTMLDESIPLTTNEFDEWGNPGASEESFRYMLSYSPYDNVEEKAYPNLLVTTGLHDSQVQYFEPAKWVAKLRDQRTNDNALVFTVNMEAGHGGASGRFRRNKLLALEYAFFLDLAGVKANALQNKVSPEDITEDLEIKE